MPLFNVHLYPSVRVMFPNVEAESHDDALRIAQQLFLQQQTRNANVTGEYADEMNGALIDVVGDDTFIQSIAYDENDSPSHRTDENLKR